MLVKPVSVPVEASRKRLFTPLLTATRPATTEVEASGSPLTSTSVTTIPSLSRTVPLPPASAAVTLSNSTSSLVRTV